MIPRLGAEQKVLATATYTDMARSRRVLGILRRYGVPTFEVARDEVVLPGTLWYVDAFSSTPAGGRFIKMVAPPVSEGVLTIGIASDRACLERSIAVITSYINIVDWLNSEDELPFMERTRYRSSRRDYPNAIEQYRRFKEEGAQYRWELPVGLRDEMRKLIRARKRMNGDHSNFPVSATMIKLS